MIRNLLSRQEKGAVWVVSRAGRQGSSLSGFDYTSCSRSIWSGSVAAKMPHASPFLPLLLLLVDSVGKSGPSRPPGNNSFPLFPASYLRALAKALATVDLGTFTAMAISRMLRPSF